MTFDGWKARDEAGEEADRRVVVTGPCAHGQHEECPQVAARASWVARVCDCGCHDVDSQPG